MAIIVDPNAGGGGALDYNAELGSSATASSSLAFYEDTDNGTNKVTLTIPSAISANYTFTLPSSGGTSGYLLSTDGSGTTSWVATTPGFTQTNYIYSFAGNSTSSAEIRLYEDTDNGTNYTALKAASNLVSNNQITLPSGAIDGWLYLSGGGTTMAAQNFQQTNFDMQASSSSYRIPTLPRGDFHGSGVGFMPWCYINTPVQIADSGSTPWANRWFFNLGTYGTGAASGFSVSNDVAYCFPIFLPKGVYDNIRVNIHTADASGTGKLDVGIFATRFSQSDRVVGIRLYDCGTITSISTTGEKTLSFTAVSLGGWYWICLRADTIGTAMSLGVSNNVTSKPHNIAHFGSTNSDDTAVASDSTFYGVYFNSQTLGPFDLTNTAPSGSITAAVGIAIQAV